jgi:hypothetical protein
MSMVETMYEYYRRTQLLPTYAAFSADSQLARYEEHRRELFANMLALPPQVFRGARVIEFGPDTGENALVFARWGADIALVEPNENAWSTIRGYFDRFGLSNHLKSLTAGDVRDFTSPEQFDIVVAEGFIYTVQPTEAWLDRFARLLPTDGYLVTSYYEASGFFFELLLKAIYRRAVGLSEAGGEDVARRLFEAKWDAIPHTRKFSNWWMDVLENPFVRLRYGLDASTLCRLAKEAGFELHCSWPRYHDDLVVRWHKRKVTYEERLSALDANLDRARLGYLFGRKAYFCGPKDALPGISGDVARLATLVDGLIDAFDPGAAAEISAIADRFAVIIASRDVLTDDEEDRGAILGLLSSMKQLMALMSAGDLSALAAFCSSDAAFIAFWGAPHHLAVFRRAASSEAQHGETV